MGPLRSTGDDAITVYKATSYGRLTGSCASTGTGSTATDGVAAEDDATTGVGSSALLGKCSESGPSHAGSLAK